MDRNGIVFIFGAGASKAENAPGTEDLLPKSLTELKNDGRINDLRNFLREFFYVDAKVSEQGQMPTFEEVLTMIDMSLARQEDFSSKLDYRKLSEIRDSLVYSIAKILDKSLENSGRLHKSFVRNLFNMPRRVWNNASFIDLNYDLLLDNALINLYESKDLDLDYGIEFRNFVDPRRRTRLERAAFIQNSEEWFAPRKGRSVLLLKPHGSLNWLYCPNCNTIKTTKTDKGALKVWSERVVCEKDQSCQRTLIVPPTWEKIYDNPHLTRIAVKTDEILRKASKVFFVGYSLPDADIKLKYLLKRAMYDPDYSSRPRITVLLGENSRKKELKERYKRFFGPNVKFSFKGFAYFAENISKYVK